MKNNIFKLTITIFLGLFIYNNRVISQNNEWKDTLIFKVGTEPLRTNFMYFTDKESALQYKPKLSPFYKSLNGTWKFSWCRKPDDRPVDFYKLDFNASQWDDIQVPGDWQLQGYGVPYYKNIGYPFKSNFPHAPEDYNPVGSYIREFEIPEEWNNKQIFLHFAGVNSAFYVWINGKYIGYREDTKTASEFNITSFIVKGKNKIAVEVYRWCDGSYFEDQDMWRFSGIERDVFLYAANEIAIRNIKIIASLDENYKNGIFSVEILINN